MVHELVHHLDFKQIDSINADFLVNIFSEEEAMSELEKTLTFFFLARSEMRAFYYDEKYLVMKNLYTARIDQITSITDDYRCISFILARLIGKIKCWEEMGVHHDKVIEANTYIMTASKYASDWGNNISNSFEYRNFHTLCEQILKFYRSNGER